MTHLNWHGLVRGLLSRMGLTARDARSVETGKRPAAQGAFERFLDELRRNNQQAEHSKEKPRFPG